MTRARDPRTDEIIERITALVRERLAADAVPMAEEFVHQYFAGTAAEDLSESSDLNLYGAAMAHLNYARQRQPGNPKLHVYNPQLEQHGWQSTHTIVELVTDDMPFLVDSVRMALNHRGLTTHLIIHPVVKLRRSADGALSEILPPGGDTGESITEAVMHCEVDRQTEPEVLEGIRRDVDKALADVRVAVEDWRSMREKLREALAEIEAHPPRLDPAEVEEGKAFLEWVDDNHFTFLGYREYELAREHGDDVLRSVAGSGLGVLRNVEGAKVSQRFSALPLELRREARKPGLLIVTKGNFRATVHRPGFIDYIGIKRMNAEGKVWGERRFVGLYTSGAYNRSPREIPLLRKKVRHIIERAGYSRNSHAEKTLINILETYPRDALFQVSEDELLETALGILHLQERQRIRLFVHRDRFERFVSCIVFVPRERWSTAIRLKMQGILEESFNGECTDYSVELSESVLARLYFVIRMPVGKLPAYDVRELEARLREVTRSWKDMLAEALLEHCGEERGTRLLRRYGDAFRADYQDYYSARVAVHDIEKMEMLEGSGGIAMSLYRRLESPAEELQFKLFRFQKPISLSEAMPMLENMGLTVRDERPSTITSAAGESVWMHDFGMVHSEGAELDIDQTRELFQEAFARIWRGEVENDGFNRLVLRARLSWREIVILRAACKYLRQAGVTFSQEYIERALASNPSIARQLVQLFHARFDPAAQDGATEAEAQIVSGIQRSLDGVANLDEDRILRSFLTLIQAMLRTNYYQPDAAGALKPYVSFKLDPDQVPELPEPRPMFEIFVYSPRVEGVHLRGGPVARGGLRWSDRREDFRTEVLGLVKAQMVKNAVIVPVGSKGGFVPKQLPIGGDRDALMQEGIACYQTFIRGLLDVTDNLDGATLVPPPSVVRRDRDDPYLVVAADKGTATFSDFANAIALEYGYWLGDGFASGGSVGYDHKEMGITARGGWESVKRHFRELGLDTQTTDFTVVGIGDMAGDVFGNGMLLSEHIKLVGAFNHQHIFLDPNPDPAASFRERKRLFELPRSSWADYDQTLISKGGGVVPRSAKSIRLSPEVRGALDIQVEALTPNDLIRALLQAPVDLLWNGGIGTYVKASYQQHGDAGDRANDALRIDANQLRCRVVGEGGNLGFTQLARVEFSLAGGRMNTDAIDNSAGVDCSDHEVNIKILLNAVVAAGDMTYKQRNALLEQMTDEVASLVLRNNYLQTQALSCALGQAPSMLEVHERLIDTMARAGTIDPHIEFLPDREETAERRTLGVGLTAPELSVLLAYVKIKMFQDLLDSDLPEDAFFKRELEMYFPTDLRERYRDRMSGHRLWREIISTVVANGLVNRVGISFAFRLSEETGADVSDIARAYTVAREVYQMEPLWSQIEALDNKVPAQEQVRMMLESRKLVERASRWLLRNRPPPLDVGHTIEHFAPGLVALESSLDRVVTPADFEAINTQAANLTGMGVPEELARRVAGFNELYSALDIVEVATSAGMSVEEVAAVYFKLGNVLDLHWLRDQIVLLPRANRWQALARAALRDDLYAQEAALTADVLRFERGAGDASARIDAWMAQNRIVVGRCQQVLADLKTGGTSDFAMLSVAMREIRALRQVEVLPVTSVGNERAAAAAG